MVLFFVGLAILIFGGIIYSKVVESQFQPDDRETPAVRKADGVDYVTMSKKKNWLINLLNIAGTGPILGPIQGILFGPIAFLAIPLGCVFAGAVHDYATGMISMRNGGSQVPKLVGKYLGTNVKRFYNIVIAILLLLTGTVFVYTPGDLIANDIMGLDPNSNVIWIIYGIIFIYYILSTVLPIDKLIGRIYPLFGAFLLISSIGVFAGIIFKGLSNLQFDGYGLFYDHPGGQKFIPSFFITVACGILSGFHGSQVTLVSRTVSKEKEAMGTFYSTMITEGFIAMIWAAGALVLFSSGKAALDTAGTLMVGQISRTFMGSIGGYLAIIGVIALPITSGDTAFRSLRLIVSEELNIDQKSGVKRASVAAVLFIPAIIILVFAKSNPNGFNILWRYFGFTNQFVAIFALGVATTYLITKNKNYLMTLIPGIFYAFIVFSFIISAKEIGFGLDLKISYILGAIIAVLYGVFIVKNANKRRNEIKNIVLD
ncbi:MAG: carbon starvation CstA family protein [Anaerococcus hydrogenalis]|uniref:carbon starvation CstA family protein n=1 Tax=Anaerococcus hydrogenalis TaxID=33029 RepID=UPI0028FF3DA9|nr:carbon starvation CstA family protein [Anaerococcus hydrogenalis]MDU2582468.1 carbon starvation CstA family protein [Anaerococcus hydrogenalis]MDU3687340.1 carbon starvation CstA family protein [Anaerococcus hydrogenalis]